MSSMASGVSSRTHSRFRVSNFSQCIHDVQQRREMVQLVYSSHDRWPLRPSGSTATGSTNIERSTVDLRISVLDSSFNPPTLAHLALARSRPPNLSDTSNPPNSGNSQDYDARLLLLSVRNADKASPKPGEATYEQRLEMMLLLAQELEDKSSSKSFTDGVPSSPTEGNVAVAIINEPTFVRKSIALRRFLQDRIAGLGPDTAKDAGNENKEGTTVWHHQVKLSFIMGFDTLERFLAPRYYNNSPEEMHTALRKFFAPPRDGDGSEVACAWRGEKPDGMSSRQESLQAETPISESWKKMQETLSIAQPFVASGSVSFTILTDYEMTLSSTDVRTHRVERRQQWRAMVPQRIGDYIEETNLYGLA